MLQDLRGGLQGPDVRVFRAERQMGDELQTIKDADAAQCEVFGVAYGIGARQFQHQRSACLQGGAGAQRRRKQRRHAALREAAAHQAHDHRVRQLLFDQRKLAGVACMERIVFT